jgi:hypothetical protein
MVVQEDEAKAQLKSVQLQFLEVVQKGLKDMTGL